MVTPQVVSECSPMFCALSFHFAAWLPRCAETLAEFPCVCLRSLVCVCVCVYQSVTVKIAVKELLCWVFLEQFLHLIHFK